MRGVAGYDRVGVVGNDDQSAVLGFPQFEFGLHGAAARTTAQQREHGGTNHAHDTRLKHMHERWKGLCADYGGVREPD